MNDLRSFINQLEKRRQLKRIKAPVSRDLEIAEITDRVSKSKTSNYALLFENVEGFSTPVLMNAMGSPERMALALGVERLDELSERVGSLVKPDLPKTWGDRVGKLMEASEIVRFGPKIAKSGPCQEVVETLRPSLAEVPVLKCWPEDGGRFITLPLVFSRHPETGKRNVGMYRMQIYDERTTGMHWHLHKGGAEHYRASQAGRRRIPLAVAIGAHPAITYSATAPLPPEIDEMMFAGWLRRESVELVKCVTVDLEVPADAEYVLEGYVDPDEQRIEGPFGDHTGYYSLADQYPVFHLTALTRRKGPIYHSTIVGRPPQEDAYLGKATERIFLPLMKLVMPEIVDVSLPPEGVFHNLVLVSIRKSFPGHARKVMYGLWGLGQMMFAKSIVVFDADVNVQDPAEVVWRLTNNVDPRRDTVIVDGPLDALDHSSPLPYYGSKIGIDATRKGPGEGHQREWPADIVMSQEVRERVDRRWKELGIGPL